MYTVAKCNKHTNCWDLWRMDATGEDSLLVECESYQIVSNILNLLNNPDEWEDSEAQEIADSIRNS